MESQMKESLHLLPSYSAETPSLLGVSPSTDLELMHEILAKAIEELLDIYGGAYEVREELQIWQSTLRARERQKGKGTYAPILQRIDDIATELSRLTTKPASFPQE